MAFLTPYIVIQDIPPKIKGVTTSLIWRPVIDIYIQAFRAGLRPALSQPSAYYDVRKG